MQANWPAERSADCGVQATVTKAGPPKNAAREAVSPRRVEADPGYGTAEGRRSSVTVRHWQRSIRGD